MQNENRKKKKQQTHQVTLITDRLQNGSFPIPQVQNAYFPYQPYIQQSKLIYQIYKSIKQRGNALIESPTGTGKTLCMLVASLSCLCTLSSITTTNHNTSSNINNKVPKIFYLTRTHSQITQVVNELKRIPWYQCKINIIASRQHLCINRNLKQLKGRLLDRGCQQLCKQKLCKFKQQTSQNCQAIKKWLTLQQLCDEGNKKLFCPFYYSKMSTQKCQLTIMPFNYLLDWSLLQHNNFNLKNSIIIFDEAHNIDSLAQQGSSLQIDTDMLTQCLVQVKNLEQSSKCRYLHKKFDTDNDLSDFSYINQAKNLIIRMNNSLKQSSQQQNYTHLQDMLKSIKKLTNFVSGEQQFKGVDLNNYEELLFMLEKVKKIFIQKKIQSQQFDIFFNTLSRIMKILDLNANNMEDYYMFIGPKTLKNYTLKFNCLNASFTFQRISQQKPRSIILCSGTLGNFEIWQKQLGIKFQTKLKVPSFITSNQVCVDIIDYSLNKQVKYQFSFQNKNRQEQFQSLGQQLKQIQKIVPNGIVVGFSTYELMQKCMKFCIGFKKAVFYESKNQSIDKIYGKYSQAARSQKGAFLFIVLKGKFSQGINFNNQLCRCLIVIGIPFLPPNDYKVVRKKAYLQNKLGREQAQQWYYSQTFKSVNQVIGRAIRSKQDYGCILLFDIRYGRKDIKKQLPSWFTNNLPEQNFNSKYKYTTRISNFFNKKPWLNLKQQKIQNQHHDSFELALQKTIQLNQKINIPLETLLNQQTPIKIKKPNHKKLKIISDQQQIEDTQTKDNTKKIKPKKIKQIQPQYQKQAEQTKKHNRIEPYPWLSINYFIEDQIKDYIVKSKQKFKSNLKKNLKMNMNENRQLQLSVGKDQNYQSQKQQTRASLTLHHNNKKIKKYM